MGIRRALKTVAAPALALPLLATAGPAAARRTAYPAAPAAATGAPSGLGRAYVTDPFAATVTVIDTRTFEIVTVIPVGFLAWDATLSPDEKVLYVATEAGVDVIDTATNTVTTTIPSALLLSRLLSRPMAPGPTWAMSCRTRSRSSTRPRKTVVNTIPLNEGSLPSRVAVSPDGARVYVTNAGANTVSVLDTATNTVIATIPVGAGPFGVDVAPEGSTVYITGATNRVDVIDVASNTVTKTLAEVAGPVNLVVTARRVYVAGGVGQLSVIDRVVEAVVKVVSIAPDPENPFSSFAYGLAVSEGPPLPGNPIITTQASPSNLERTVFTDTATVTGGINPTGEVIFRTYTDANCTIESGNTIVRPLVNGTATAEAFLPVGTIYWRALYTGDANNNPATTRATRPVSQWWCSPLPRPPSPGSSPVT